MPNGRPDYRRERGRQFRGGRDRRDQERRGGFDLFFDDEEDIVIERYAPRTNRSLLINANRSDHYPELGLTAERFQVDPQRASLFINERSPVVRGSEDAPGEGETVSELLERPLAIDRKDSTVIVAGRMSPQIGTALIVRDLTGKERVWAFNRPELESFGRGESGPTGMLQIFPDRQIGREVNQEYIGFAKEKSSGAEVIVAVDTGEPASLQMSRVIESKRRITHTYQRKLQQLLGRRNVSREALRDLTDQIKYVTRPRRIVRIPKKRLSAELERDMKTVTTEVNGETETTRALVRMQEKRPTIIRPVCIEPESSGIDIESLKFLDASGKERDCHVVEQPSRIQVEYLRDIARRLGRPELIQKEPKGQVILPAPLEVQRWSHPESVLPPAV